MTAPPTRILAIDWSGVAGGGQRKTIWLAEIQDGRPVRLECGRTREELTRHLIDEAERDPDLVVGLDFAFSGPEWFLRSSGHERVEALWEAAARDGEAWLGACEPPFWGRPGRKRPELRAHLRRTEERAASGGSQPKSVFQIGGAGAVGTGSIRGMPTLARLRRAGFSVWPFHAPERPLVVEIYPRVLTGRW